MLNVNSHCYASSLVKSALSGEHKTADTDSSASCLPGSESSKTSVESSIGDSNSTRLSHRQVSINTATTHSLLTTTETQDLAALPEGPDFLLRFPEEHLFLLFADPVAIIYKRSPRRYERREPGCTAAWCRGMSQVLDWLQHDPVDAPLISRQRYMEINKLLTEDVQNMNTRHIPGKPRKSRVLYISEHHSQKGIMQALRYKQQLEENYELCRGTSNATIEISENSEKLPDRQLLANSTRLEGINICFWPLGASDPTSRNGVLLFQNQLVVLLEREIITPLNKQLRLLKNRKITKPRLLIKLIRIVARYWPRLEQIHAPLDGTCRTNYMLMQYIFMKFGFPPPVLMDPNSMDLVDTSLGEKIIGIGLKNSLGLMNKKAQVSKTEAIIHRYTKRYLKHSSCFFRSAPSYQKYLIPDELNFSDKHHAQMKDLTKAFIEVLASYKAITQTVR
ncbi:hypothetical protein [Endozoicomonas sp. ONNA2]|uniref:hypothetical protein n=1 Tax=Endozoicomonas sp. ONNA2 TaxID=2828741 RepID=UPI0021497D57|nr:hypothetical protein [Endozoicomonas sp. ONNA2]